MNPSFLLVSMGWDISLDTYPCFLLAVEFAKFYANDRKNYEYNTVLLSTRHLKQAKSSFVIV